MSFGGTHVLTKCDDVHVGFAEVAECLVELVFFFAEAEHDAGFGDEAGFCQLGGSEDGKTLGECCSSISDLGCQSFGCFHIVCVHV